MVTIGAKPQAVDLLNFLGEDSFELAWERRTEASFEGLTVPVIGLHDLVRSKRVAGQRTWPTWPCFKRCGESCRISRGKTASDHG